MVDINHLYFFLNCPDCDSEEKTFFILFQFIKILIYRSPHYVKYIYLKIHYLLVVVQSKHSVVVAANTN